MLFHSSDLSIGGLLYYDGDSDSASLNPALNAAMLMQRFSPIASTSEKKTAYLVMIYFFFINSMIRTLSTEIFCFPGRLCYGQKCNVRCVVFFILFILFLSNMPFAVPYVVGSNPNSPANPHSAMASGGMDIGHIDTSPPQEAYVIYGAVVGGPDKHDKFFDIRSDWPQTEVYRSCSPLKWYSSNLFT